MSSNYNCVIGPHINHYLSMIHWDSSLKQKESSILTCNSTWVAYSLSYVIFFNVFNPKKTNLAPVGPVMQTKEIFPLLTKKEKRKKEITQEA